MQALQATTAHEIDRATITEAETLVVNGEMAKATAAPVMQAGDFYFRPTVVTHEVLLRQASKTVAEIKHAIVMSCPFCGLPIMTNSAHSVLSKRPLTIERPIACPYAPKELGATHAFTIKAGTIIAAH